MIVSEILKTFKETAIYLLPSPLFSFNFPSVNFGVQRRIKKGRWCILLKAIFGKKYEKPKKQTIERLKGHSNTTTIPPSAYFNDTTKLSDRFDFENVKFLRYEILSVSAKCSKEGEMSEATIKQTTNWKKTFKIS